ncbi:Zinc finger ZZ-type [Penicillium argentinense]|uniref:Zinc finger ZZ-type n=1 Tax=Penicillium argentinense TaxID=1131581 RepID=A0A9W9G2I4_9EURO|nr:Zinc finger ZZ-type [Penicillium argentinense]KAJ5110778.1 Zinc finger ZZ-type [Penicillium argentinense]
MATPALPTHPGPEHLVTVKVLFDDSNRRFKLPLKDLRAQVLPQKLRTLLGVPADVNVILERYSDSAGSYMRLDPDNVAVYKQLYRAAKAKSKLRIKASTVESSASNEAQPEVSETSPPRHNYLQTVLSSPIPVTLPETNPPPSEAQSHTVSSSLANPPPQPHLRDFSMDQDRLRFPCISHHAPGGMFCIDCNNCGRPIPNEHYHCSICENGDYDLCLQCVEAGASCRGEGHWLIKRTVVNGRVVCSNTETIAPRPLKDQQVKPVVPVALPATKLVPEMAGPPIPLAGASVRDTAAPAPTPNKGPRSSVTAQGEEQPICNGCCREAEEANLVRCNDCEDYDLCLRCLLRNKHGHHPGHTFSPGTDRNYCLKNLIMSRCLPGRQFKHAAVCDGCDKRIVGTRHKCLSCPDWDYCNSCAARAQENHPGHRFAPIYEAIGDQPRETEIHYGIFCDGPLCKDKPAQSYIHGIRYKCAVCDDVDFCANCEAFPTNAHNHTHPLIKFKSPVRSVSVNTFTDDLPTGVASLGDQVDISPKSPEFASVQSEEKQPVEMNAAKVEKAESSPAPPVKEAAGVEESLDDSDNYQAYFIRDAIADGTKLPPDTMFRQTWTLYNPGPRAWPAGSDVRFVGGDTMFNVDGNHPSSVDVIRMAMESNKLTAPLEPGSSTDFSVTLRTPRREGTAISYWRLKLPNGVPIGHRLWCDIQVQGVRSPAVSTEVAEKEDSTKSTATPETTSSETLDSGMIFPKLDKESPEASTHQDVAPVNHAPTLSTASEGDVLEDVESLTLEDTSTDAGFLTDEEYDVLDASDQEFLEAKQSIH